MPGFKIRQQPIDGGATPGLQVFVSKYRNTSDGSDAWFDVPGNWNDHNASLWTRPTGAWELVAFKDHHGNRRGYYLKNELGTVNITFYGFSNELGVEYTD